MIANVDELATHTHTHGPSRIYSSTAVAQQQLRDVVRLDYISDTEVKCLAA